jgi:UDP-galactopyranose mutase
METSKFTYVIVGAGLAGSVLARKLAESKKRVLVLEKKNIVSGHILDKKNEIGILVQQFGPHAFHTNKENVYEFITRYHEWYPYILKCEVFMDGKFTPSPFNFKTIDDFFPTSKAAEIKLNLLNEFPNQKKATILEIMESKNFVVAEFGNFLFEKDYRLYTAKQWGIEPSKIDKSVLRRVPVRFDYVHQYFDDKYQLMPKNGFKSFIDSLLNHPNIEVNLNFDALNYINFDNEKVKLNHQDLIHSDYIVIYTGPIDRLFNYEFGLLPYRSLSFEYKIIDKASFQSEAIVAYPQVKGFTRITEYSKLPHQNTNGKTVIAYEYPTQVTMDGKHEPYYPIPTNESKSLYEKYLIKSLKYSNLILCGRLADFKYYNMDDTIDNALKVFDKLILNV